MVVGLFSLTFCCIFVASHADIFYRKGVAYKTAPPIAIMSADVFLGGAGEPYCYAMMCARVKM